ncbi:MAG: hypothetical protein ACFB6R_07460 [Alphaproteobacteria bacterium]
MKIQSAAPTPERLAKAGAEPRPVRSPGADQPMPDDGPTLEVTVDTLHGLVRRGRLSAPQQAAALRLSSLRTRMGPPRVTARYDGMPKSRTHHAASQTIGDGRAGAARDWERVMQAIGPTHTRVLYWLLLDGCTLAEIGFRFRPGVKDRRTRERHGFTSVSAALDAAAEFFGY